MAIIEILSSLVYRPGTMSETYLEFRILEHDFCWKQTKEVNHVSDPFVCFFLQLFEKICAHIQSQTFKPHNKYGSTFLTWQPVHSLKKSNFQRMWYFRAIQFKANARNYILKLLSSFFFHLSSNKCAAEANSILYRGENLGSTRNSVGTFNRCITEPKQMKHSSIFLLKRPQLKVLRISVKMMRKVGAVWSWLESWLF